MPETNRISMYEMCLVHSRADRSLRLMVARELDQFDITMMQWLLLATVANGPAGGMRMTELAAALDVTMPQITALMNDLIQLKLAKQKVNNNDRRSRRLTATPNGKKLIAKIDESINSAMRKWFKDIPDSELKAYLVTVNKLAELGR